jgi:hypothetical protein
MPKPIRTALRAAPFTALLLTFAGCADLQIIPADECGNDVLEAGEECDGEADCGPPGSEYACRILCVEGQCRPGRACGLDGLCRAPSGTFEVLSASATSTAVDLFTGDINLDGCSELFLSKRQSITLTAFESHKPGACPAQTQEIPSGRSPAKELLTPTAQLTDMNRDGRPDLVRAAAGLYGDGLFVDLAGSAPVVASLLYPTVKALESPVRTLRVTLLGKDALLLLLDQPMGMSAIGLAGVLDPLYTPQMAGTGFPGVTMADLAVLAAADLNTANPSCDACDEVLAGFAGKDQILSLGLSKGVSMQSGQEAILATPPSPVITLPPGAALRSRNASMAVVDQNGDGHLDVIVNTETGGPMGKSPLYVAYGTGTGKFHSTAPPDLAAPDGKVSPLVLPGPDPMAPDATSGELLFVAADFDGAPGIEIEPIPCPPSEALESIACNAAAATGCEAVVFDIDRDGLPDVVSTEEQQPGLLVRRPTAGGLNVSFLDTACPPHGLASGDFDGDGTLDLAYFDQTLTGSASSEERPVDTLMIAYGNAYALPGEPLATGRFEAAQGLIAGNFSPEALTTQLYATRALTEMAKSGFALVEGYGARGHFAPYYLPYGGMPGDPNLQPVSMIAGTAGLFGEPDDGAAPTSAFAVVTRNRSLDRPGAEPEAPVLLLFDARAGGSSLVFGSAGESPECDGCVLVPIDIPECAGAAGADDLLLLSADKISVYSVVGVPGPQPGTTIHAFELCDSFGAGGHTFSFVDQEPKPDKYVPRPLVADLDRDGRMDVVARDTAGALVVLWSKAGGGFEATESSDWTPPLECGRKCSVALADVDGDGEEELVVAAPGGLAVYHVPEKSVVPEERSVPAGLADVEIDPSTDFTAIVAADFDGDGLDDIALMPSSGSLITLRAVPATPEQP